MQSRSHLPPLPSYFLAGLLSHDLVLLFCNTQIFATPKTVQIFYLLRTFVVVLKPASIFLTAFLPSNFLHSTFPSSTAPNAGPVPHVLIIAAPPTFFPAPFLPVRNRTAAPRRCQSTGSSASRRLQYQSKSKFLIHKAFWPLQIQT